MFQEFVEICIRLKIFIPGGKRGSYLAVTSRIELLGNEIPQDLPPVDQALSERFNDYLSILDCILGTLSTDGARQTFTWNSLRSSLPHKRRTALERVNIQDFIAAEIVEAAGNAYHLCLPLPDNGDELFFGL